MKEIENNLQMGNFNFCMQRLSIIPQDGYYFNARREIINHLKRAKGDLWINPEHFDFLKKFKIAQTGYSISHQLIIPCFLENIKQGMLLFPDCRYIHENCGEKERLFKDSFYDAYENLLPTLWKCAPLVYVTSANFAFDLFLPGEFSLQLSDPNIACTEGHSAGLGFLLSMLMSITNLRLNHTVAITGWASEEGQIRKVEYLHEKIEAIVRERGDIEKIIVPKENPVSDYQGINIPTNKIFRIQKVEEALEICFGKEWAQKAWPIHSKINTNDREVFFSQARSLQKEKHEEKRARMMYKHLSEYLEKYSDASSRNLLAKTLHRLGGTYHAKPDIALQYLNQAWSILQQLEKEEMLEDGMEKLKILTSFYPPLKNTFRFQDALEKNKKAMELEPNKIKKMPLLANHGEILVYQQKYEEAEKLIADALEIAKQAGNKKEQVRYRNYLLKLYTLWEKWEKGAIVYQDCKGEEDGYSLTAKIEFLSFWKLLNTASFPSELSKEQSTITKRAKKDSPEKLYCHGLSSLTYSIEMSIQDFQNSEASFLSSYEHDLGVLLSILPFVWQHYAMSVQENRNLFSPEVMQKIFEKMNHYLSLNDLQKPLEAHIKQGNHIGDDMEKLKHWCYGFRKLLCW